MGFDSKKTKHPESKTMHEPSDYNPLSKVYYRPIEAAIRWSGLIQLEREILEMEKGNKIPEPDDFPDWPALRLNSERIYDAVINKELPVAINGVTVKDSVCIDYPDLTIRHVDLKAWMTRYYPDQRPEFLFSWIERHALPAITMDAVHALVFERDALKFQIEQRNQEIQTLHHQHSVLLREKEILIRANATDGRLSPRSETTYLNIVGSLLNLLLGRAPSGQPYSSFKTQEAIISAMVAHHAERLGITERTLQAKFAAARRTVGRG